MGSVFDVSGKCTKRGPREVVESIFRLAKRNGFLINAQRSEAQQAVIYSRSDVTGMPKDERILVTETSDVATSLAKQLIGLRKQKVNQKPHVIFANQLPKLGRRIQTIYSQNL